MVVLSKILTQDISFNEGLEVGFQSGLIQRGANPIALKNNDYKQDKVAGYKAAVQKHIQDQVFRMWY